MKQSHLEHHELYNNKIKTIPHYFNINTVNTLKRNNIFPKVITLNNTFANIDNIYSLVKLIKKIMLHDSVLIIETSYTGDIVKKKIFDWIYHEHLSYFAIKPLNKFFKKLQLEIFDIEINSAIKNTILSILICFNKFFL